MSGLKLPDTGESNFNYFNVSKSYAQLPKIVSSATQSMMLQNQSLPIKRKK